MKEREVVVVSGLVTVMLVLWLGFVFHQDPRFAGSLWGGILGISGSVLMLVPLGYMIIKRVKPLKILMTRYVSMPTLLAIHIYAGIVGPILAILHTGHKFNSGLGIALTGMTITIVISGFVGRYLLSYVGREIKEKSTELDQLNKAYEQATQELQAQPELAESAGFFGPAIARLYFSVVSPKSGPVPAALRAVWLAESIADLEYAIRTHEVFKKAFKQWLRLHIVLALILYFLMAIHIFSEFWFGIRWLT
jgi:hypothetical protein